MIIDTAEPALISHQPADIEAGRNVAAIVLVVEREARGDLSRSRLRYFNR